MTSEQSEQYLKKIKNNMQKTQDQDYSTKKMNC